MNPVNFEDMNCIFKAEGCGDLPALKAVKHYDEYGKKEKMPNILQIGDGKGE